MSLPHPITTTRLDELKGADLPRHEASIFSELPEGSVSGYGLRLRGDVAACFTPTGEGGCPNCDNRAIEWSLAHGEAHCLNCGYPARVYHYFYKPGEGQDTRVCKALWYHPDGLKVRS